MKLKKQNKSTYTFILDSVLNNCLPFASKNVCNFKKVRKSAWTVFSNFNQSKGRSLLKPMVVTQKLIPLLKAYTSYPLATYCKCHWSLYRQNTCDYLLALPEGGLAGVGVLGGSTSSSGLVVFKPWNGASSKQLLSRS